MKEHFKRHLSQFCKCGEKMSMNSQGWNCPNDKKRPTQYINYSYKKGFKDGSIATLKEVYEKYAKQHTDVGCKTCDECQFMQWLEAKIKELEK